MTTPSSLWSPLEPEALAAAAGPVWDVRLLPTAASTNALAAERPLPGTVVVADHQTAGRGRLDRTWETPPGTALTFSAVVDPRLDDVFWPLLPLATAVAVADGIARATGIAAGLKWPNDLLIGEDKVAGILLERVVADRPLAVIGVGLNVGMSADQLPVPTATSLAIAGATASRTAVFGAVVQTLAAGLAALRADPPAMLTAYRAACTTLGREVTVHLPDGSEHRGTATDIDAHGRLLVGGRAIGAGDVLHVRA